MMPIISFLLVSRLSVAFVRHTWRWSVTFRASRKHTFSFLTCLPITHENQCLYVHIGQWYHKFPMLGWQRLPNPLQWIHTQSKEAKGHCTGYHTDRQKLSLAHGPSQSKKVRLIAQPTWSSWYVTVMPMFTMVQIVVFLTAPYSKTTRESWKILASYLPPVSLVANPSQSPSLARPSQLGFRTLAVNTLGE